MVKDVRQLPGIDPSWVRTYNVERDGHTETFSVLESSPLNPRGTILCVHGNPTWSYMWRHLVKELGSGWRIIAIDQLGMGFSSRPRGARTLATRIDDIDVLLSAAQVEGKVTLIAHDWGGPVSLGWATKHAERVERLVLFNTGTQIPTTGVPGLIRVSNTPVLRNAICANTKAFVIGAVWPTGGIPREIRSAYYAPYSSSSRRRAIADFVADIPTSQAHITAPVLEEMAARACDLKVPTLLMWGTKDFVFHTGVLADMQKTFPHAQTVTLDTGHLSPEHPDAARLVHEWLDNAGSETNGGTARGHADLNAAVRRRASETPHDVAVFDAKEKLKTSWSELNVLIQNCRGNLLHEGAIAGDRVAILAPFTAHTIAFIYASWAEGLVPVVADPGLGIANMRRALRESRPKFVLTVRATRFAARGLHIAHRAKRFDVETMTSSQGRLVAVETSISDAAEAAVLYTSGATGPAKGVVYTHGQLRALAAVIQKQFAITDVDGIAAAYIPFALYGPAWGVAVALPKINVVAPSKLSSQNLREALDGVNGSILFAAPAPLRNVIKDGAIFPSLRCVMSAGAPVSDALLRDVARAFPQADLFSPYGMTEMLIVSDGHRGVSASARGVPVGLPLPEAEVMILPMGFTAGQPVVPLSDGTTGEVFVTGPWLSAGYDQHWARNRNARVVHDGSEWHRTGDVGHLDNGLFIEGRIAHIINTGDDVLTPVPLEQAIEEVLSGVSAAAVGVPAGSGHALVVVLSDGETTGAANSTIEQKVRAVAPDLVAVLYKKKLPVDRRHNSKIDRTALGAWAAKELS
jgi:acyl-coenzyme A synthetase/AMP-(fatty) acid ligase/pimeloyl-ACP methyl ester carboxylesterase